MSLSTENKKHHLTWEIVHVKMQNKDFRLLCLKVDLTISL